MTLKQLEQELQQLQESVDDLEPNNDLRNKMVADAMRYANHFIEDQQSIPAFKSKGAPTPFFSTEQIQNEGTDFTTLLQNLDEHVHQEGLNPASGGHLGYIPGGGIFPAAVADFLAAVFNRYAGVYFASPGAVGMENFLIRWLLEIFEYPETGAGFLASGGSIANLTAIVTARDASKLTAAQFSNATIYLTDQSHHCIDKAIRIAGLGAATIRRIQMDERYRMDANQLATQIKSDAKAGFHPLLIVASAGTTDTGAIDPLKEIGELAKQYDIWYHIDAAYGGFFNLLQSIQPSLKGIELSDSLVVDPHKGLFLPYGIGALIVKDAAALHHSHQYQANYMQDAEQSTEEWSPAEISPELTKHFRGLRMWLPLKLLGLRPFKDALWEKILLARYFYEKIQALKNFEVGPYPDLSVVIYRYMDGNDNTNEKNLKLAKMIQEDGRVFISSTTIYNKVWLRVAVLSFRTHQHTIDQLLELLEEKSKHL